MRQRRHQARTHALSVAPPRAAVAVQPQRAAAPNLTPLLCRCARARVLQTALAWAQRELNKQLLAHGQETREGYVCNLRHVKEMKETTFSGARSQLLEAHADLQAKVTADISPEEMLKLCRACLAFELEERPMVTMQTFFELRATHMMAARHDDLREETLNCMFVRDAPRIRRHGSVLVCNVTNGGKTNVNGNLIYSGAAPHVNPLLCCIFARACLFVIRFNVRPPPPPRPRPRLHARPCVDGNVVTRFYGGVESAPGRTARRGTPEGCVGAWPHRPPPLRSADSPPSLPSRVAHVAHPKVVPIRATDP